MAAYDVAVIGGGPGGYSAAIRARQLGLKTALIEDAELGGICLNWGCIPTKALLKQAEVYQLFLRAEEFGLRVAKPAVDWDAVIGRSRQVAAQLSKGVAYLMQKNQVEVFAGRGRLTPSRQVAVEDAAGEVVAELDAAHVVLATGSHPKSIPGVEFDGERIIASREAMVVAEQPASLAIIGAGAIGVEFAYFYRAFGSRVLLLEALPQVLPREDEEIAAGLAASLEQQGIEVVTEAGVEEVKRQKRRVALRYQVGGEEQTRRVDQVLVATGVEGNIEGWGWKHWASAPATARLWLTSGCRPVPRHLRDWRRSWPAAVGTRGRTGRNCGRRVYSWPRPARLGPAPSAQLHLLPAASSQRRPERKTSARSRIRRQGWALPVCGQRQGTSGRGDAGLGQANF